MKEALSQSELWSLSAEALHTEKYKKDYVDAIDFVVRDKNLEILDTAGGTGFPTLDLFNLGYKNISVSDLDEKLVEELTEKANDMDFKPKFYHSRWQDLAKNVPKQFDIVLNTDNAFVYMDGWLNGEHVEGVEAVLSRVDNVLKNYFEITKKRGMVIIGLGKHYSPTANKSTFNREFSLSKNSQNYKIVWTGDVDWEKRVQTWTTSIESESFEGSYVRTSYLLTKDELVSSLLKVGFRTAHILEPNETRDNLIVGIK